MIHSVGCPQPSASVFIKQWNKSGVGKCVHAFIQANGEVYQTLPWNYRGWHGGGSSNNTHIGVEMCEPSTIKYGSTFGWVDINSAKTKEYVMGTYKTAVELFAKLCKEFNLNPLADGVIISHSEGCKRGIASNHADVEHIWNRMGLSMEQFRKDIAEVMKETPTIINEDILYLVEQGRINSPQFWIDALTTNNNLKYLFSKWADDVKKLNTLSK